MYGHISRLRLGCVKWYGSMPVSQEVSYRKRYYLRHLKYVEATSAYVNDSMHSIFGFILVAVSFLHVASLDCVSRRRSPTSIKRHLFGKGHERWKGRRRGMWVHQVLAFGIRQMYTACS